MSTPYTRYSTKALRRAFTIQKARWHSLPSRRSFSALHISGRLDSIQQVLAARRVRFTPFHTEVYMEVG